MIDLNAIANSAVVASQHQVNRTPVIKIQNNAVKMEQELKPAPSNVIQKLTIPQLIGYMQNADESSIRKLFKFLSKEQVAALQGINSQIEDEELREVIANYSAPDDDFDDVPDDTEVESVDTPISDDEDVDVFDDSEVESADALAKDDEDVMFDEDIESSDENVSDLDVDLFDDEDELSSEDEELVDLDDNNSFIIDDVDDIDEDSLGQEEPTPPQGTIEPTLVVPATPQGITESVESNLSPSDMNDEFDDIPEDEFDSEDFDDIAEDKSQVDIAVQSVNDSQPLVESVSDEDFDDLDEIPEDTSDNFDDIPDDEAADEVVTPQVKVDSPRIQVATPLLDELVNPTSQGIIGSSDTKSVQDSDAFDENFDDEFDEVESDSSDDFDDFDAEDDTVDVDEAPTNLVDTPARVDPATSKIVSSSPVEKPVVEPEPDIAVQDEVLEEPVIEKPVSRQSTKHLGSPRGTIVPSRKSVSSGQIKKSAVQSEFSSAFKGIRGLDDIEDITEAIEIPVKRATKSIDTKPQAQLPCSDGVVESKGKAGSTLSRDPSIPEPTVGELYEKGWTLMTYMSKNRGNKAAMHLDVVGKYFPMAVIKAGEARGKFTIHKNYLRK